MPPLSSHRRVLLLLPWILPSALGISFSDFESISSTNDACLETYESSIPGCSESDFSNGAACSSDCILSLSSAEQSVTSACEGIVGPSDSLLGSILSGGMVVKLCPNVAVGTSKPTRPAETSTRTKEPPSPKSTPKPAPSSSSTSSSDPTTKSSSSPTSSPSQKPDSKPSSSSSGKSSNSVIPTDLASATDPPPKASFTFTPLSLLPGATSTGASSPGNDGGGGSPFDNSSGACTAWSQVGLAASLIAAGLCLGIAHIL
ncbi:MAG: hypothetical protein M1825_003479 [Sarcosagium campestre]|nr:MAG: hypothetical protein M1825_003479 [Sarcosagium campestre]